MTRRLRPTLRGVWWRAQLKTIRHCYACGGSLASRYVANEKRRRLVCAGCGQITYVNPKVVAGLIPVLPDGRIVLLRRSIEPALGRWTYPAGFQEMGETVAEAARRETAEEIGVDVAVQRPLGIYSYADAGVVTIVYVGRVARGVTAAAGVEALEVRTFKPSEIPWEDLAFRSTTEALRDWMALRRSAKVRRQMVNRTHDVPSRS